MAVLIGSARCDEKNKYKNGTAGDQTGKEVTTQNWYKHVKGWVVIRAKDSTIREKIAKSMEMICANNKIGYDQGNRNALYNASKSLGFNASKVTKAVECDCSSAVRVCCAYAGITTNDFNTSMELNTLKNTGKFNIITDSSICNTSDYLLRGDILVTKTTGHTVVVLSNGSKASSNTSTKPSVANPIVKSGSKGNNAKLLQSDLNYVNSANLTVDGDFGPKSVAALKNWQTKNGLTADGVYGTKSQQVMKKCIN